MKVYVAGPWARREEVAAAAAQFEAAGFEITKPWWNHPDVPEFGERSDVLNEQAIEDYVGVTRSDVFVLMNLEKSEGKAVETGFALALGVPIILIGPRLNIFNHVERIVVVETVEEAIEQARELEEVLLKRRKEKVG